MGRGLRRGKFRRAMSVFPIAIILAAFNPIAEVAALDCAEPDAWLHGERSSRSTRKQTRARIRATCSAMGASREACNVLDVIVVRESSGDPCAVHVLGPNEWGLGPLGLSVRYHLAKWDRTAPEAVLKVPEVAAVIGLRIFRRAVQRYRARSWAQIGAVFAGRFRWQDRDGAKDARFCHRLERRGIDCNATARGQLGRRLGLKPTADQAAFVGSLRP